MLTASARVASFFIATLLIFSLVFPTALIGIKFILLILALLFTLISSLARADLNLYVLLAGLFYSGVGLVWSIYGELRGNAGALQVLTVMVVYPVLFVLLTISYRGQSEALGKLFFYAALLIAVLDIFFVFGNYLFPYNPVYESMAAMYGDAAVVDNAGRYIKFTLPNVSSLIFLIPYVVSYLLYRKFSLSGLFLLALLLLVAFVSGRRALLLVAFTAPFMAYFLTMGADRFQWKVISRVLLVFIVFMLGFLIFYNTYPDYVENLFLSISNFSDNDSNLERRYQFEALMKGVYQQPFFGMGAGAIADYIRSEEMPWAYELFYVSLVFQYGMLGFLFYALGVLFLLVFLVLRVRKIGRRSFEFCYLSGMLAFLMATATNPYLAKFDYMWVIFIPVALLNYSAVSRGKDGKSNY
ncbi:hypothetical protein [Pseudomonas aeruginosa]|uniref:hypothetical protein n=1 Tax=Pseudomonas aeruginosa TaxID=287 RepID=UPI000A802547|nr:hypothetical protein [Pseudomonas aeruginosa]NNB78634.1 hypothetical protein [Pseudomonas aeruginosa]RUB37434.1 hypothetical protein IPC1432_08500 [Pseudomonas aeruginosa]HBN8469018.1 hypothetical protein [Pseudomonas aeruginosa]HCD6629652.1 hypothetical protein [Pseudomonas aeruginosa]HCD7566448.1 hypothetical protein [Pseudomonas aeruginosa]